MNKLKEAQKNFIAAMSYVPASKDEINMTLQECMNLLPESSNDDVIAFMKDVFKLTSLPDQQLSAIASNICGYLVEIGYPSSAILDELVQFYNDALDRAHLFFEVLSVSASKISVDDEKRDEKIDELYSNILNDPDIVDDTTFRAVNDINEHYTAAISVFSIDKDNLLKAKELLGEKVEFVSQYSQGAYWLNLLFQTLFDESVVVIDIDSNKGFAGKISGIVDNYQLQHMLMSLPQLNPTNSISEEDLAVVNGTGKQIEERSITSKWNLYNLELCAKNNWREVLGKDGAAKAIAHRDTWIWSEGIPRDISIYNGYRVVLLGEPSFERSAKVQRTFKNLKAKINIDHELSGIEINEWLSFFAK